MSGSSTAARKFSTEYLCRRSYILQEVFVILYTGMPYNSLIVFKNILQIQIIVQEVLFLGFVAWKKIYFLGLVITIIRIV
jgi:hypothetical protein